MSYSRLPHGSKSRRSNSISSRESLPGHIDKHHHHHTDVSSEELSGAEDYELEVLHGDDEGAAVDITSSGAWRGTSGYDGEVNGHVGRRSSFSTTESFTLYTPDEERRVIRKFDKRLVLFVAFLYMLSFLDRSSTLPWILLLKNLSCLADLFATRHWQCESRRSVQRPRTQLLSIRVASEGVLHYLYQFRVDDFAVEGISATHLPYVQISQLLSRTSF